MQRIRAKLARQISYANVVSTMALVFALGGVSWAATTLPKNSVGAKQIKKSAVTQAKISANAIDASKIADGSLGAADIDEATLGIVPSATHAANAATAAKADSATVSEQTVTVIKASDSSAADDDEQAGRVAADEVPLVTYGQITVYGKCWSDPDDDQVYGAIFAKTSTDGAWAALNGTSLVGGPALDVATDEVDRYATYQAIGPDDIDNTYVASAWVIGPNGKGIAFDAHLSVRNGSPGSETALYTSDESCVFALSGNKVKF